MEDLYSDLENYNNVDVVNELRAENSELKQKLGQCMTSMESLQKDFDKLSAEFKKLETNYSSLLKIARAEIKRKTDMIANLNIEKDMLVIKANQIAPRNKIHNLIKNAPRSTKFKKKQNKAGSKEREEISRGERERPPSSASSSTATVNNKMLGKERVTDHTKSSSRITSKENEFYKYEASPDRIRDGNKSPVGPIVDRRVSLLAARHQFSKLSSDEEFEDMYSALEPKTTPFTGPERSRKRGHECRDDPQDTRTYYNSSSTHNQSSHYPDPFREGFNNNRTSRFTDSDKNMNRDRPYNESDRHMNKEKYDMPYRKYSPERYRRGAWEYGDDRYPPQYDRHRRLETPPRERRQYRSRERRSYHDRERDNQIQDVYRYPDTHTVRHSIHGEYDEPQNKRPRIEQYPNHQKDRRLSETQYCNEIYPAGLRDHTCQSPDLPHIEHESSNEPVREIKSTASTLLEDPRLNSKKYIKSTEGDKEVLQSVNASKIDLQPVNKSHWNLQIVEVPKGLTCKPAEISEELVDKMNVDKPLSIRSIESGEVGSETTDTVMDDLCDYRERNERVSSDYNRCDSSKNYKELEKDKSPIGNSPKDVESENVSNPTKHKLTKSEKPHIRPSVDEPPTMVSKDNNIAEIDARRDKTQKPSILHRLILSVTDTSPERDKIVKLPKSTERKKHKKISKLKTSNKSEKDTPKGTEDKSHKSFTGMKISVKSEKETLKSAGEKEPSFSELKTLVKSENEASKNTIAKDYKRFSEYKTSDRFETEAPQSTQDKGHKISSEFKTSDKSEKENSQCTEDIGHRSSPELKTSDRSEKEAPQSTERKYHKSSSEFKASDKFEKEAFQSTEEKGHKSFSEFKTSHRFEKEAPKSAGGKNDDGFSEFKISDQSDKETDNNVSTFSEFEHRVFSTRHIVEGDLELSDETNDETLPSLMIDEKNKVKKKQKIKKKSHRETSKETHDDLETTETTRKTRSKTVTEKEVNAKNKFSELFGDSSSLITPEELKLATLEAHAIPADCYPPLCEDAQDGIAETLKPKVQSQKTVVPSNMLESKVNPSGSTGVEDKHKIKSNKDYKNRTYKKYKDAECISNDTFKNSKEEAFNEAKEQTSDGTGTRLVSEVKLVLSSEKLKEMQKAKMTDVNKKDPLKPNEKLKEHIKGNKRRKDEKRMSIGESTEGSDTRKPDNTLQTDSMKSLVVGDNKENTTCCDNSERNISTELANIFGETNVSGQITSVDSSIVNEEKLQLNEKPKVIKSNKGVQDIINIAPVIDEPGLVKTVVISSGTQPLDSNIVRLTTPLLAPPQALATSTPAKEMPSINTSSEREPKIDHTARGNVTITSEDSVSKSETDAPDIRINYYRRRRKVLKR